MMDLKLWESSDEEMVRIHYLNNIVRYNTRNKINPETVASHSFFTAYFVLSICRKYKVPAHIKSMALECAVLHDVPEIFINDITYDCKMLVPEIKSVLLPYERAILNQVSPTAADILFGDDLNPDKLLAKRIVDLADVLSVKQYALSEVELGNTAFNQILESSEKRVQIAQASFEKVYDSYVDRYYK